MNDDRVGRSVGRSVDAGPGSLENLVVLTHVVYALHAFAVVSGILGSAAILVSFLASLPSIIAVLLNYFQRSAVRGTWLESHFRWQIRTFWFALLWVVVAFFLIVSVIGVLFGLVLLLGTSFWVIYRVARGWWRLAARQPMPMQVEAL